MDHNNKAAEYLLDAARGLLTEDLHDIVAHFRKNTLSEFVYDKELDVFRFEDGRFAFCQEFADWKALRERGYLNF